MTARTCTVYEMLLLGLIDRLLTFLTIRPREKEITYVRDVILFYEFSFRTKSSVVYLAKAGARNDIFRVLRGCACGRTSTPYLRYRSSIGPRTLHPPHKS